MSVSEKSSYIITLEYLNLVAVAATAQQETAVGRDVEMAGMRRRWLVADEGEKPGLAVDSKDGDALGFQAIARV